ncbi:MAG: hypothetical protein PHD07_07070 [Bacteroidales bacterium]|nr:hypothetical protein [Bacteroidales bacterium]
MEKCLELWDDYYVNGGTDPTCTDGYSLNQIRRQVLSRKQEIEKEYTDGAYPEIYHRKTPPEIPNDYMAKAEEIRARARESLALYYEDENYLYLWEVKDRVPPKEARRLLLKSMLRCTSVLEFAILTDNLVVMRQYMDATVYLSSFTSCAEKIRELIGSDHVQSTDIGIGMGM